MVVLLLLCGCAAPAHLVTSAAVVDRGGDGAARDSALFGLLPMLVDDVRGPGNRDWPLLVDVESFAAAGSRFVGHDLSRAEVAAALGHPFTALLNADLERAWQSGRSVTAEHAIHLLLDSLETMDVRVVATVRVLSILRAPDGSNDGDSTIFALTYERAGSGWRMVSRRVVLVT